MKRMIFLLLAIAWISGLSGCFLYSTGETEVGVRTKKFTLWGEKGVEDKAYPPGSTLYLYALHQRLAYLRHQIAKPGDGV